jgi:predicted phage gp36 major capsid-like protein
VTADGGILIADMHNRMIRKVSGAGTITRVAGTGSFGSSGDDGPATDAELRLPTSVAVTPDGGFLIADMWARVVRLVSASGTITRVAGTGSPGNSGDDGVAVDAELSGPLAVAVTADGGFLIADQDAHVVRMVSATGTISRVAGTGTPGNSGDDGPAIQAQLTPSALTVTTDGGILIADAKAHVIREVTPPPHLRAH